MYDSAIIIIPTLNEKENLKDLIPKIFGLMTDISVLIVDDKSNDGTSELVESLKINFQNLNLLERVEDFGYGRSCIDGFMWVFSKPYDSIVTMDGDFSHDFNSIPPMIEKLADYDFVCGSRYVKDGGVKNWNIFRRVLSRIANLYVRLILHIPIADVTTGFNAYRADSLKKLNLKEVKSDGYAFLVELKYKLTRAELKAFEYPITFLERREGQSKMSLKIVWESIKLPWKLLKI